LAEIIFHLFFLKINGINGTREALYLKVTKNLHSLIVFVRQNILQILPRLRRFAFALTGEEHDADDLLQGTIEKLLKKGVPEGVSLDRWAFRVCKNLWVDETRRRKVRVLTEIEDLADSTPSPGEEHLAINRITLKQVNKAMERLPEDQRSTLALVALGGLSYSEVAEVMDIPIGTVMSRVARARKALAVKFPDPMLESHKARGSNELH